MADSAPQRFRSFSRFTSNWRAKSCLQSLGHTATFKRMAIVNWLAFGEGWDIATLEDRPNQTLVKLPKLLF